MSFAYTNARSVAETARSLAPTVLPRELFALRRWSEIAYEGKAKRAPTQDARIDQPTPYPDYPNPASAPVTLFPTRGGAGLGGTGLGGLAPERPANQGHERLVDDASIAGEALAAAAQSPHRLLYASPVLEEPVHLSGFSRLTLRLAADRAAANLSVWLVSLPWSGSKSLNDDVITRTWADPQNAASLERSVPLTSGQFVELTLELQPDDQIIAAGEQIGLMVFSSDRGHTLWPAPGTELTLDLDAMSLVLPVVGGAEAWTRAVGGVSK